FLGIWSLARKMEVSNKEKFQMRNDKVQCQCCGKWMVPRPIYGRSFMDALVGWMGTSKVVGNMCPFCLSEDWDGGNHPRHKTVGQKTALLVALFFMGSILEDLIKYIIKVFPELNDTGIVPLLHVGIVVLVIYLYRKHRFNNFK
ncbi:hypothetical protein, partial [Azotobacter beijerinckii]|uniref:hypothetical protein n=1 Tax=Azotobacter beijerinckii TaxID=170623 RepID=UPI001C31D97C